MMVRRGSTGRSTRRQLFVALGVCVALLGLGLTTGATTRSFGGRPAVLTSYLVPVGNAPAVPPSDRSLGTAPASTPLHIDVVLQPRDPAALQAAATNMSTPGNPLYEHFLARGQFASVFGPTPAAIAEITAYLRNAGLTPGTITPDHLIIPVETTVGRVDSALHISMNLYRQPRNGLSATAVVNADAPTLPAPVASLVQGIIGLDTVSSRPRGPIPAKPDPSRRATPSIATAAGPKACSQAVTVARDFGGWTENQLAQAYSFNGVFAKGDFGGGATIALFEEQTYSATDIKDFQRCYGTKVAITNVSVDHGNRQKDFSPEAALDIETVIGLAPKAALRVYETSGSGSGPTDGYDAIVSQDKAQVISSSWSTAPFNCDLFVPNSVIKAENTIFQEAATQGQSVFVANGDVGSEGCMSNGGSLELGTPGEPDAVAVNPTTHTVYVANDSKATITVLNEYTLGIVKTVGLPAGSEPDGLAVDPHTNQLWVSEFNTGALVEIDGATCDASSISDCSPTVAAAAAGADPEGIAVDSLTGTAYVALAGFDEIAIVDESTLTAPAVVPGGDEPAGVAVDASSNAVYYTDFGNEAVGEFSGATCDAASTAGCPTTANTVSAGLEPVGVAVDHATNRLYVANFLGNSVTVLKADSGDPVTTVNLDRGSSPLVAPLSIALAPNGEGVLVTALGSSGKDAGVAVISTKTNAVTRVIGAITAPSAVASDPDTGSAFVADFAGGIVWLPLMLSVEDPSGQPFVTGVGGTDLIKLGPAPKESVWDEPLLGEGAGTGGISSRWAMPSYQKGPGVKSSLSSSAPCHTTAGRDCRELPDVSASADPAHGYVIVFGGSWTVVGGTSAATPLWAALTALLDVYGHKLRRLGFLNPALYKLAAEGKPILNDVTVGNNDYTTTNGGLYPTTKRYDMATGLGTPIVTALAKAFG